MRQCFEDCRLYCQRSCLMISGYFHFRGRAVCTPCISDAPRCFRAVFRKPVTGLFYFSLRFISVWNIIKKIQGRQFCTALRFFIESILNLKTSLPVYPRSYFNIESKESSIGFSGSGSSGPSPGYHGVPEPFTLFRVRLYQLLRTTPYLPKYIYSSSVLSWRIS